MKKEALLLVMFAAFAAFMVILPAKKAGNEIPFEPDGGTILQDPAICANQFCHSIAMGSTLNELGTVTFQNVPLEYVPGQSYEIGLLITGMQFVLPGTNRVFGLQLTAFFEDETQAGSLEPITPGLTTVQAGDVTFLAHEEPLPSGQVDFRWTAPPAGDGAVTSRVAANAGNNDEKESGDAISTNEVVISEGENEIVVFYYPQIGIGTTGPCTFNTDLIFVNPGAATSLLAEIFASSGNPMAVRIEPSQGDPVVGDSMELELSQGASIELGLRGLGELSPGYVRVTTGPAVGGGAVFSFLVDPGDGGALQTLFDSGVPSSSPILDFSLSVQVVSGVSDTGVAIVNVSSDGQPSPSTAQNQVTLSLYDQDFELVEATQLPLDSGQHLPRFASQLFQALGGDGIDFRGSMTVTSDQPLSAVTLRQTTVPTLTALPVIPGRADQN